MPQNNGYFGMSEQKLCSRWESGILNDIQKTNMPLSLYSLKHEFEHNVICGNIDKAIDTYNKIHKIGILA